MTASNPTDTATGALTFLFTDIEGSTRLWEEDADAMRAALARHDALLRSAITANGGRVFKTLGDQFCAVFADAPAAVAAALSTQRALLDWGLRRAELGLEADEPLELAQEPGTSVAGRWLFVADPHSIRVRMALYTGPAEEHEGDFLGPSLSRVARLLAAAHGGQTLLSEATTELVREALPAEASLRDLGVHGLRDLQAPEHLYQLLHPSLPADFPPLKSLEALPNNLPQQLTSFIGREREIAHLRELLTGSRGEGEKGRRGEGETERTAPLSPSPRLPFSPSPQAARLVTLTGAGGCGKTRLALQVAVELLEDYPDGVWLVELAVLTDPSLVPQRVAFALSVREQPGRRLDETLADFLRTRTLLLVLDNCEHLLVACAHLAEELLRTCPGLRVLATSREGLGIAGERTYPVPPLALPAAGVGGRGSGVGGTGEARDLATPSLPDPRPPTPDPLLQFEAIRLFVERAAFGPRGFVLTEENGAVVAQLCRRLDGIPLAIELAAAQVKVLSVEEILSRLDDRFRLLTGGSRTALPRQQTLRAAMDWGYDLLSEPERALLRRLSVFAGGFTLEASEGVCAEASVERRALSIEKDASASTLNTQRSTLSLEARQVLELLTALIDKSLVLVGESSGTATPAASGRDASAAAHPRRATRYHLLETVREYGRDRLIESGEAEWARRRHRDWFLALAERIEPELRGPAQATWLECLETEHDNLRAALEWSVEAARSPGGARDLEASLCLGAALARFWWLRGYLSEGRERLAEILALAISEEGLATEDTEGTEEDGATGRGTRRGDRGDGGTGRGIGNMSFRPVPPSPPVAPSSSVPSVSSVAKIPNPKLAAPFARALLGAGNLAWHQGDHTAARTLLTESVALSREIGDQETLAFALTVLGVAAERQGEDAAARSLHAESVALFRESGDQSGLALSLSNLGRVVLHEGDLTAARALNEESAGICRKVGDPSGLALALNNLGEVARCEGDYLQAERLYEECLALFRGLGHKYRIAAALHNLGYVSQFHGRPERAAALFRESLALAEELEIKDFIAACLAGLAGLAVAAGEPERAARLLGASEAMLEALGIRRDRADAVEYVQNVEAARAALGGERFEAAYRDGRKMSVEEAVASCVIRDA